MSDLFSRKCDVNDLLNFQDDDLGYIEAKVFMVWPPRKGMYRVQLEIASQSTIRRFEVEMPYQDGMVFRPQDHVSLSLKGARIDPRKASSAPHALPVALRYPDGVALRYLSGKRKGKLINTWRGHADEWYNPGPVLTVPDAIAMQPPKTSNPVHASPSIDSDRDGSLPSFILASHLRRPFMQSPPRKKCRLNESRSVDAGTPPAHVAVPADRHRFTENDAFTSIGDVQKGSSRIHIVGIVSSAGPVRRTRTNEWSRSRTLVDESTVDSGRPRIVVNCFQKKHVEWLPQVKEGDVVILRNLKVSEFQERLSLIGYTDKLRWAVYDPDTHSIRAPNDCVASDTEDLNSHVGYEFSPYWKPQHGTELDRCRNIGGWWKTRERCRAEAPLAPRRRHLLVSEASPDLPPGGFFDCTIEVLKKFENGGHDTIYVTDYTTNPMIYPISSSWCPPQLCGYVLQCEMWDEARIIAKMMKPGEYWYLNNVRAKWNPHHYMEGKMNFVEKVERLVADNLEAQPRLVALLERKHKLGLGPSHTYTFPKMLLKDVVDSTTFLTCVVELLSLEEGGQCIYVTDYTYNPELPTTVSQANWVQILKHYALKVVVDDVQATFLSAFNPGAIVIIRNLGIHRSEGIQGYLRGKDPLVELVPDLACQSAQTLLRCKERWQRDILPTNPEQSAPLHVDLEQALLLPAPGVFNVLARISDFYPFHIEDASVLRCPKCKPSVPGSIDRCPTCGDRMDLHGRWFYSLFVQLEDDKGNKLVASLSGKECLLLAGVNPTDFRSNPVAFDKFLAAMDPILGNLREVHEFLSRDECTDIKTPLMVFTLKSWTVDEEKAFSLWECTPV